MATNPTTPQTEVLDYACSGYQLDPISLRRSFLLLLRNHYGDPSANFGNVPDAFKRFKYSDNDRERVLNVDLDYMAEDHNDGKVPAVYIGIGDIQLNNTSIIDKYARSSEDRATLTSADVATTTLDVVHRARTPDEALQLGMVTLAYLNGIRKLLQERMALNAFYVGGLSKPSRVKGREGQTEREYNAAVQAFLAFPADWETNIESHRIKKVALNADFKL